MYEHYDSYGNRALLRKYPNYAFYNEKIETITHFCNICTNSSNHFVANDELLWVGTDICDSFYCNVLEWSCAKFETYYLDENLWFGCWNKNL